MISADVMSVKFRGVVRLTRWKEYVPFVIPVTTFGAILAVRDQPQAGLDWRLAAVIVANILAVAYAFMINDIEDAPDDAREAERAARNPVASGELTTAQGWLASGAVAALTMLFFALAGLWPFVVGLLTLSLSHFYSWKPVRLKAWPVTDILSHSLMLSGLLFLAGYFAYDTTPGIVWLVALAVTLISCYGQLYNQLRDYDMDRAAGLNNTAIIIGKRNAQVLMYSFVAVAFLLLIYSLVVRVIPFWIAFIPLLVIPLFFLKRGPVSDMRGAEALDLSGSVQWQLITIANVTVAVWLIATLLGIH